MSKLHEISDTAALKKLKNYAKGTNKFAVHVGDFARKKAALYERFAADLRNLTLAADLDAEFNFKPQGTFLAATWDSVKNAADEEATCIEELAKDVASTASAYVKHFSTHRQTLKLVFQDMAECRDGISRLNAVCEKARMSNDACFRAKANAEQSPSGMMKKISDSAFIGKYFQKMTQDRAVATDEMTKRSHNDYIMQLAAANVQRRKYFDLDLPEQLDTVQLLQNQICGEVSQMLCGFSDILRESFMQRAEKQTEIAARAMEINADHDISFWIGQLDTTQSSEPEVIEYAPPMVDGKNIGLGSKVTTDGEEQEQLGQQMWALDAEISNLATKFKAKNKEALACEQMYEVYSQTPSFGPANEAFKQLYNAKRLCRNIQTTMQRNQAVISQLQIASVTPKQGDQTAEAAVSKLSTAPSIMSKLGGGSSGSAPSSAGSVSGLLSWTSRKKPANKSADRSSMVSEIDDVEDWDDDNDFGMYDANAITAVPPTVPEGETSAGGFSAVALYDYAPQNEDELELHTGDQVEVTGTSDEWWTGVIGSCVGIFPAAYARQCDASFDYKYRALYDYTAANDEELSVAEGDLLAVQNQTDDGWSTVVSLDGTNTGMVPTNYVQHVADGLPQATDDADADGAAATGAAHNSTPAAAEEAARGTDLDAPPSDSQSDASGSQGDAPVPTSPVPPPPVLHGAKASLPIPRASIAAAAENAQDGGDGSNIVSNSVLDSLLGDSDEDA